jgi:hypothetical protein
MPDAKTALSWQKAAHFATTFVPYGMSGKRGLIFEKLVKSLLAFVAHFVRFVIFMRGF